MMTMASSLSYLSLLPENQLMIEGEDMMMMWSDGDAPDCLEISEMRMGSAKVHLVEGIKKENAGSAIEAVKHFKAAAEQGAIPEAQYRLGCCYKTGRGVKKDSKEAANCFLAAAEQGHAAAQWYLASMYKEGEGGLDINRNESTHWLHSAAYLGDVDAQSELGFMYYNGDSVERNLEQAANWFQLAAYQEVGDNQQGGGYSACLALGALYYDGEGVEKDENEGTKWLQSVYEEEGDAAYLLADMYKDSGGDGHWFAGSTGQTLKWLERAATKGNIKAQEELGDMYSVGKKVDKNDVDATKWLLKAAEGGSTGAQVRMGIRYCNGLGVRADLEEAKKWLLRAQEDGRGSLLLAIIYDKESNPKQAAHFYHQALRSKYFREAGNYFYDDAAILPKDFDDACQDLASCWWRLALMYQNGEGVEKSEEVAVKYFHRLANWYKRMEECKGECTRKVVQYRLGVLHEKGLGVREDMEEAGKCYLRAAEEGHSSSQFNLGIMYDKGLLVVFDDTKKEAAKWYVRAAQQGHPTAQFNIGHMYQVGEGVDKNVQEAREWYEQAAAQGSQEAQDNLRFLLMKQTSPELATRCPRTLKRMRPESTGMKQQLAQLEDMILKEEVGAKELAHQLAAVEAQISLHKQEAQLLREQIQESPYSSTRVRYI